MKCQRIKIYTALCEADMSDNYNKTYHLLLLLTSLSSDQFTHSSQISALELNIRHEVPLILLCPTDNCLSRQHSLAHRCQKSVELYFAYSQFAVLETVLGHILQLLTWVQSDFNIKETSIRARKKPHGSILSLHISHSIQYLFSSM